MKSKKYFIAFLLVLCLIPNTILYANNIDIEHYTDDELVIFDLFDENLDVPFFEINLEIDPETGEYISNNIEIILGEDSLHKACGLGQMTCQIKALSRNKLALTVKNTGLTRLKNIMYALEFDYEDITKPYSMGAVDPPGTLTDTFTYSGMTTYKYAKAAFTSVCGECYAPIGGVVGLNNPYY